MVDDQALPTRERKGEHAVIDVEQSESENSSESDEEGSKRSIKKSKKQAKKKKAKSNSRDSVSSSRSERSSKKVARRARVSESDVISEDKEEDVDFKNLSYEDVQINLRLLSDLKEGEKLMITDDRYMQVDQRYMQGVRRYLTADSRIRSLNFISHVIDWAKKYCTDAVESIKQNIKKQDNLATLINIQKLLGSAQTGLGRLLITYGDDKHNKATIETYIATVNTFCDRDLKKAIDTES